ncbi:MAG: hypothetical protein KFKLKKLM_02640 [Flavobacteriales bacterium]|nr:hypothetical protein [Flavobacteriales bacterium]
MDYLYNFGNHVFDTIKSKTIILNNIKAGSNENTLTIDVNEASINYDLEVSGNNNIGRIDITYKNNTTPDAGIIASISYPTAYTNKPCVIITSNTQNVYLTTNVLNDYFEVYATETLAQNMTISFSYMIIDLD